MPSRINLTSIGIISSNPPTEKRLADNSLVIITDLEQNAMESLHPWCPPW